MADKNILTQKSDYQYVETAPVINPSDFQKVIESRRSVRIFLDEPIPEAVMDRCLRNALLAPNSSNLQPWEFYRVTSPDKKKALVKACLSQVAAKSAAELVVAVARTATWRGHAREMVELFNRSKDEIPAAAFSYYRSIAPFVYTMGPLGILGFFKRFLYFFRGLTTPIIREPVTMAHLRTWAVKTTALGAENLMLSLRAYGYDSCPLEGVDSRRIRKILGLRRDATVVMVIAAGKRGPGGIYGRQVRFDPARFIKTV